MLRLFSTFRYFRFICIVITLNSLTTADPSVESNIKSFHFQQQGFCISLGIGKAFILLRKKAGAWNMVKIQKASQGSLQIAPLDAVTT